VKLKSPWRWPLFLCATVFLVIGIGIPIDSHDPGSVGIGIAAALVGACGCWTAARAGVEIADGTVKQRAFLSPTKRLSTAEVVDVVIRGSVQEMLPMVQPELVLHDDVRLQLTPLTRVATRRGCAIVDDQAFHIARALGLR
jgi:hypothetical protein